MLFISRVLSIISFFIMDRFFTFIQMLLINDCKCSQKVKCIRQAYRAVCLNPRILSIHAITYVLIFKRGNCLLVLLPLFIPPGIRLSYMSPYYGTNIPFSKAKDNLLLLKGYILLYAQSYYFIVPYKSFCSIPDDCEIHNISKYKNRFLYETLLRNLKSYLVIILLHSLFLISDSIFLYCPFQPH